MLRRTRRRERHRFPWGPGRRLPDRAADGKCWLVRLTS